MTLCKRRSPFTRAFKNGRNSLSLLSLVAWKSRCKIHPERHGYICTAADLSKRLTSSLLHTVIHILSCLLGNGFTEALFRDSSLAVEVLRDLLHSILCCMTWSESGVTFTRNPRTTLENGQKDISKILRTLEIPEELCQRYKLDSFLLSFVEPLEELSYQLDVLPITPPALKRSMQKKSRILRSYELNRDVISSASTLRP